MSNGSIPTNEQPSEIKVRRPWYDKKVVVILWLIFFFPVGLLGLLMSTTFDRITKVMLAIVTLICVILVFNEDSEARKAGFNSKADQQDAARLNIETSTKYYEWKERFEKQREEQKEKDKLMEKDLSQGAYWACQEATKENLSSPSSADFPLFAEKIFTYKDQRYVIKSYVDSQNNFGAMIRTYIHCNIKYSSTSLKEESKYMQDSWEIIELEFTQPEI